MVKLCETDSILLLACPVVRKYFRFSIFLSFCSYFWFVSFSLSLFSGSWSTSFLCITEK